MTRHKLHYYVLKQFFPLRAKKVQIRCIITWKEGFLMTRQTLLYLMHYSVEKQIFS